MNSRRAWLPSAALLALVYLATAAPDATFWDAGELIAAGHALGIPHPPGTPLFILVLHAWGLVWPAESYAFGANVLSALLSAAAGGIVALLVYRWNGGAARRSHLAFAAAICGGATFTIWANATEAEVYSATLLLAATMLLAGDAAGRGRRGVVQVLAYLFGLSAALHVGALVAAPAAIALAAQTDEGRIDVVAGLRLGGAAALAMAIGTWSLPLAVIAGILLVAAIVHPAGRTQSRTSVAAIGLVALGATPILFMLVRAAMDPAVNQGNPSTFGALADVIARRQYDQVPLWPRRAPLWIQLGNWFEFADWQFALSLGPTVIPTVARTTLTLAFAALAIFGSVTHRAADRRSWRALLILFLSGSFGVALYLNLRASPSFGWGVLPDGTPREARERDYFFALGFWVAGVWAGIGAISLAARRGWSTWRGVAIASLPIVLNWAAVSRRQEPEASMPLRMARGLLEPLPQRALLFTAGDNDTYPLWYVQQVLGVRRDVVVVTVPLLGAHWYVDELTRRHPEFAYAKTAAGFSLASIRGAALASDRPVAASIMLERRDRERIGGCWSIAGMVLRDAGGLVDCMTGPGADTLAVDTVAVNAWLSRFPRSSADVPRPSTDPVHEYVGRLLSCPRKSLELVRQRPGAISLATTCNP